MTPLPYMWPYALVFWVVFVWAFLPEARIVGRARRTAGATDQKSVQVLLVGMTVACFAAFPLAWVRPLQFPPAHRVAIFWFGVVLLGAASLLRRHCWRMLGGSFTGDVRASGDQEIVTRGAYAILRHPSYTGGILMYIGMGTALGSWFAAALLAVASFVTYSYRIAVDERALLAALGEPYRRFMSTRKRLIPFIY